MEDNDDPKGLRKTPQNEEPNSEIYEYEPMEPSEELPTDKNGYLVPHAGQEAGTNSGSQDNISQNLNNNSQSQLTTGNGVIRETSTRSGPVMSVYEDLWSFCKRGNPTEGAVQDKANKYQPLNSQSLDDEPIYDEVESVIPSVMKGAKIIPIEEPPSAYDEVIINDSRYIIPSTKWDSDSDAWESDFDDDEVPSYFGENLEVLYENIETRRVASPKQTTATLSFRDYEDSEKRKAGAGLQQAFRGCLPISFPKSTKKVDTRDENEDSSLYVDPDKIGTVQPVMPPIPQDLSPDEVTRYEIVNKILESEAMYKEQMNELVQIEELLRERHILESKKLDVIFCSLQDILLSHEMFNIGLAARMNEWTVCDKLGDIICASFSKSTTYMAYTGFVNNFPDAIDMYRASRKSNAVFNQFIQAKEKSFKPKMTFHDLMLKPCERFPQLIILIQDLLEVTPVGHRDRVPLQLALTQLECLAESINSRRRETEMKNHVKYLDSQIFQLNKPLSSSGRAFIRQDDMVHCLIDGVSIVGTKKLRLVLLSDMLLCLAPIGKKKGLVAGLLNAQKSKYKLKWNVPLPDVEFVEYGVGVSVAAGKYGTTTTYSDQGKYRQATVEIQKHIEDLQHDLAVIGQIAGLTSLLRGKHQLLDQQKVERWYKSVENTISEELKTVNMFWLEMSLPTRSGQQNYIFNLSSPTVKEEWEAAAKNAKLALETRNNPGWYLPEDEMNNNVSILRRNMPLLAELFDLFIFNTKSRVEHTLTYPVDVANVPLAMTSRGLGHLIWVSARGELQGHVTVLKIERNASVPRFVESFSVCPGTVYSMARIPAMNSRPDQRPDKYHTKYGFPFPTVWLGSHSSKIYIYDATTDDRSRPLMELKLRDAPLAIKYAKRKVYVGLANGTLAVFRSNSSEHWNLVQPSILPLGRYPVAVIADVKDKLWCGSGSQIYVVSKNGDRIQRIIAVDSNMKNLVKHIVCCGVGVWVSVWRKGTIKLYHAETCEMMQEVNVVSPVMKMRNDVDSQVQYLSIDKISVTSLLVIPGFLWVGTSLGLILLYPLPKLQGVPRVIGRACVAFHAHCGPVRNLFAVPEGPSPDEAACDSNLPPDVAEENAEEMDRKFSLLADSEESVESDEEFFFVDDAKSPSPKKVTSSINAGNFKVTVKKTEKDETFSESTVDTNNLKVNDFAMMMETFSGFSNRPKDEDRSEKRDKNVESKKKVKSFKNRLFDATYPEDSLEDGSGSDLGVVQMPVCVNVPSTNARSEETLSQKGSPMEDPVCSDRNEITDAARQSSKADQSTLPADEVNVQNTKTKVKDEMKQIPDVFSPVPDDVAENDLSKNVPTKSSSDTPRDMDKKNIPQESAPSEIKPQEIVLKENKSQENPTKKTSDIDRNNETLGGRSELPVDSSDSVVNPSGMTKQNESKCDSGGLETSSTSGRKTLGVYTAVLPDEPELATNGRSLDDAEGSQGITGERLMAQEATRSARCSSYLVVSAGEGHVDLRMKLKSKSEVKKDTQSMLLVWKVNSKT